MVRSQTFRFLYLLALILLTACAQAEQFSQDIKNGWQEFGSANPEEMPPLEDYRPPSQLFDMEEAQSTESPIPLNPVLTTMTEENFAEKPAAVKKEKSSKPRAPKIKSSGPAFKSKTQLEVGQKLVTPSASDVLASIEGKKLPEKPSIRHKFFINFQTDQTILDFNMKKKLLKDFIPDAKQRASSRIEINAYASQDKTAHQIAALRASETKDFLIAAGVEEARIMIAPVANNIEPSAYNRLDLFLFGNAE